MIDIEALAAAIHEAWRLHAGSEHRTMAPSLDRAYADLDEAAKDENRAAARRMGAVLAAGGLALDTDPNAFLPEAELRAALDTGMERMAEAEHAGWMEHRAATGWRWGPERDDAARLHPAMVPYAALPESEKAKDRANIRQYAAFAAHAGYGIARLA